MQARILTQQREKEQKLVFYAITLSLVLHIAFFTLFVILPEISGKRQLYSEPIMIKLAGGGGPGPGPATTAVDTTPTVVTPPPSNEKAPANTKPETAVESVYIPPPVETTAAPTQYSTAKPEDADQPPVEPVDNADNVKTFSSQTVKPSNATQKVEQIQRDLQRTQQNTQQATQRSETAVQESTTGNESVSSAIQQLRDKQAAQQASGGGTGTGSGAGTGGGTGGGHGTGTGTGVGPGDGTGLTGPLAVYLGIIVPIIEKNWSFSPAMYKGTPNMEVVIEVDILPSGEISNMRYVKKSGDVYLDESAFKALAKSSPLPAYKASEMRREKITMQFRFTPKGLKR